jgi:hypothetical protein
LVLLDTGASRSVVSARWIEQNGVSTQPCAPIVAKTITNETVTINQMVHARRSLVIQHVKTSVQLLPLSNMFGQADIVLGMDWLSKHAAVIDTAQRTCAIFCERRMAQLRAAPINPGYDARKPIQPISTHGFTVAAFHELRASPQFLSAKQAHHALRQGCSAMLVMVEHALQAVPCTPASKLSSTAIQALLSEYAHVFQSVPPGLPPDHGVGHVIPIVPNMPPPFKRPYRMTPRKKRRCSPQALPFVAIVLNRRQSTPEPSQR